MIGQGLLTCLAAAVCLTSCNRNSPATNKVHGEMLVLSVNGSARQGENILGEAAWTAFLKARVMDEIRAGKELVPRLSVEGPANARFLYGLQSKLGECGCSSYVLSVQGSDDSAKFSLITSESMMDWKLATKGVYRDLLLNPSPSIRAINENGTEVLFVGVTIDSRQTIDFKRLVDGLSGGGGRFGKVYFIFRLMNDVPAEDVIQNARKVERDYGTSVLLAIIGMEGDFGIE